MYCIYGESGSSLLIESTDSMIRTVRLAIHPASNLAPQMAPLNAQRANVRLASKGSKVNNIPLKTATLVLRFSYRLSLPTEQLAWL